MDTFLEDNRYVIQDHAAKIRIEVWVIKFVGENTVSGPSNEFMNVKIS